MASFFIFFSSLFFIHNINHTLNFLFVKMIENKNKLRNWFNKHYSIYSEEQYKIIENEITKIRYVFLTEEKEWNKTINDYRREFEENQKTCSCCNSKRSEQKLVTTTKNNTNTFVREATTDNTNGTPRTGTTTTGKCLGVYFIIKF